jgi:hypothetical protein
VDCLEPGLLLRSFLVLTAGLLLRPEKPALLAEGLESVTVIAYSRHI